MLRQVWPKPQQRGTPVSTSGTTFLIWQVWLDPSSEPHEPSADHAHASAHASHAASLAASARRSLAASVAVSERGDEPGDDSFGAVSNGDDSFGARTGARLATTISRASERGDGSLRASVAASLAASERAQDSLRASIASAALPTPQDLLRASATSLPTSLRASATSLPAKQGEQAEGAAPDLAAALNSPGRQVRDHDLHSISASFTYDGGHFSHAGGASELVGAVRPCGGGATCNHICNHICGGWAGAAPRARADVRVLLEGRPAGRCRRQGTAGSGGKRAGEREERGARPDGGAGERGVHRAMGRARAGLEFSWPLRAQFESL